MAFIMVEYFEHGIVSGGNNIVLSIWESPDPEAVIVFIPATMTHPLPYEPLLRGFAERGFAVAGLHPIGHGKSSRDVRRYSLRDIIQNAGDAVTFVIERYNKPVVVMGTSQGGIVAAGLASADDRIAAVFPHNIILADLPETITVTRFPKWLKHVYLPWLFTVRLLAFLFPDINVPLDFYLDASRIDEGGTINRIFIDDPLTLKYYSYYFLASILATRFPGLTDGSVRCPIYVIADAGDKLFMPEYIRKVFDRLRAPHKEIIMFNTGEHLMMLTHPEEICDALAPKIREAIVFNKNAPRV